ncbi:hypothetical protein HJFPF1_05155 [Paramyrothecium foliicola]|nr:hypothetical protein HJFPF1_05155 [Paramyrothecium foliicola]
MTKLPSEAFLPTGGLDWVPAATKASTSTSASTLRYSNGNPSPSVLSPFSTAPNRAAPSSTRSKSQAQAQAYASRPYNYNLSHTHPDAFAPSHASIPTFSPAAIISPDSHGPRRSSNQSPSTRAPAPPLSYSSQRSTSLRAPSPGNGAGSSLLRSVSADAAAPQQTSVHLVQRLTQQNALIREAWEAERNYLEANRRRAEEVYQEEREIMEDVREGWENDRAVMATEIQTLKERIQRLEGENATLLAVASQSVQLSGLVSPKANQSAGSADTPTHPSLAAAASASAATRVPQHVSSPPIPSSSQVDSSILPPGLDGASRRPHHASPGGSRMSPTAQPEMSPFIPLEPRTQPQNSSPHDFLSTSSDDVAIPTPIIDVQEIDPKLEGIPIKATAVQKSTFSETPDKASPATSPPATAEARSTEPIRPMPMKRASSKDHTLQVLAAEESRRLTMHAGHTPNHSLSLFPTISATENNNTNGPSEGTTPTADAPSAPGERLARLGLKSDPEEDEPEPKHPSITDPDAPLPIGADEEPIPPLEPVDDIPLKGPLMVKNIPAQDELFWAQVNKKLEPISQGQNALPTVVQACIDDHQDTAPSNLNAAQPQAVPVAPVGGDASHDVRSESGTEDERAPRESKAEADVPLKLRSTTNFGAPFGVA